MFGRWPPIDVHPKSAGRRAFDEDPRPEKINFRTGVFKNDAGECAIFPAVKAAEYRCLEAESTKDYLDLDGHPGFRETATRLLLGDALFASRDVHAETIHTPGGNAACWLAGRLLATQSPDAKLWLSDPTWGNHLATFRESGVAFERYPWPVTAETTLEAEVVLGALSRLPEGDAVLLHGCCHNPTGVDPSPAQWESIAAVLADRKLLPVVDIAFLGYGDGVEEDLQGLRLLAQAVPAMIVTTSWSKAFCLYRERVGALTVVAHDAAAATRAARHAAWLVRASWSNPPSHGAAIVDMVVRDPELRASWIDELAAIRERTGRMRRRLVERLGATEAGAELGLDHVLHEKSVFTTLGLTAEQVATLNREHAIYVGRGGAINVVAVTEAELDRFCDAVGAVTK
ncbi:MAG: aromatic amino acid transaminase [Planctomycetota bacterium]